MFAYSYPECKPLHKDIIDKFVGCTAITMGDAYKVYTNVDRKRLDDICAGGVPYIIADKIHKNSGPSIAGAVSPGYYILPTVGAVVVSNKKVYNIGASTNNIDGVTCSPDIKLPQPPKIIDLFTGKKKKQKQHDWKKKPDTSKSDAVQAIGRSDFVEPFCYWDASDGLWKYCASKARVQDWDYKGVTLAYDGTYEIDWDDFFDGFDDIKPGDAKIEEHEILKTIFTAIVNDKADAKDNSESINTDYKAYRAACAYVRGGYLLVRIIKSSQARKKRLDTALIRDKVLSITRGRDLDPLYMQVEMMLSVLEADGLL